MCVYDARGTFEEHTRNVRVARGAAESKLTETLASCLLSKFPKFAVRPYSENAQMTPKRGKIKRSTLLAAVQ